MRIIIGVDICENLKKEIIKVHEIVESTGAFIQWVKFSNLHITFKFLGEINDEYIPKLEDMLFDVSRKIKPFKINFGDLGAFPKIEMPRIIWASIHKNHQKIVSLREKIAEECRNLGFPKEDEQPFKAHVTIGRVKYPKDKRELATALREFKIKPEDCQIKAIKLFESEITPEGPVYSTLYETELRGKT